MKTTQRLMHFGRSNWLLIFAITWAIWLTYTIHDLRDDIDGIASEVSVLKDTTSDQDPSDKLDAIQSALERIERQLPLN